MPTVPHSKRRPYQPEKPKFKMSVDNSRFYNSTEWRNLSKAFKRENPVCVNFEICGGAADYTDHIKPISQGGAKLDWANLQSLCTSCNASKTSKQGKKKNDE